MDRAWIPHRSRVNRNGQYGGYRAHREVACERPMSRAGWRLAQPCTGPGKNRHINHLRRLPACYPQPCEQFLWINFSRSQRAYVQCYLREAGGDSARPLYRSFAVRRTSRGSSLVQPAQQVTCHSRYGPRLSASCSVDRATRYFPAYQANG